ncbi:MAG TPA: hypothetical protein VMF53_12800 [Alphaproteobacteria bacterium]|nr:hypothetical protein [Alphaproteobacteria bacterium]
MPRACLSAPRAPWAARLPAAPALVLSLALALGLGATTRAAAAEANPRVGARAAAAESAVWSSAEACRDAVERGQARMARARPGELRLGAWNVEWFPDHTDIGWLACTIAWMNLDLLALEEIRATPAAQAGMARLLAELGRLTGDTWRVDLQNCGGAGRQHVGFIWNATRLRLVEGEDAWALNARASGPDDPCAGWLRPGRADAFAPRDGTSAPFRAVAVHLKSGVAPRDESERHVALSRLGSLVAETPGARLVVLGDFNSMGEGTVSSARAEIASLDALAAATEPGFARARPNPSCTEYYRGRGGALDQALVSRSMGSIDPAATRVTGYCALAQCRPISPWRLDARPAAYRALSDHCPLVIGIVPAARARAAEAAPEAP